MIEIATVVALMPDFEAAAQIVPELGRLGVARPQIYAASLDRRGLNDLTKQLGISQLDLSDALDATYQFVQSRLPASRTRYFNDRLEGQKVLLVLPEVREGAAVCTLLSRAGADLGPPPTLDDRKRIAVPLRAEQLDIVKYLVQSGSVFLRKEIITEIERHEIPLVREELVIERTALEGNEERETIRIPLRHEQVRVSKSTVVTNEVVIRREQVQEIARVEEPLRSEQANVTKEGNVAMRESVQD